jgi:DNA-binding PadR family transcriptional regulator
VQNGYIRPHEGTPTPERGGRRKTYYKLTEEGLKALKEIQRINNAVWNKMPVLETRDKNE